MQHLRKVQEGTPALLQQVPPPGLLARSGVTNRALRCLRKSRNHLKPLSMHRCRDYHPT